MYAYYKRYVLLLCGISVMCFTVYEMYYLHTLGSDDKYTYESLPRVLCAIPSSHRHTDTRQQAVMDTWAPRCHQTVIFTPADTTRRADTTDTHTVTHTHISHITKVHLSSDKDEYGHLTSKVFHMFLYLYDHHLDDAEWFLKADDDTYVIVENLLHLLTGVSSGSDDDDTPLYVGRHFPVLVPESGDGGDGAEGGRENGPPGVGAVPYGYMSGGAGYVLNRAALKLIGRALRPPPPAPASSPSPSPPQCSLLGIPAGTSEDVRLAQCLSKLGVQIGRSTDEVGKQTFHPFSVSTHLFGPLPDWYLQYTRSEGQLSPEDWRRCCSLHSASYHYVDPLMMRVMHHLLYNTHIHHHHHHN